MRQVKQPMLAEVYGVLVLNLGQPPVEFTWRYPLKGKSGGDSKPAAEGPSEDEPADTDDQVEQKWSPLRTLTPQGFYQEFVGLDLNQYLNLTDDPIRRQRRAL